MGFPNGVRFCLRSKFDRSTNFSISWNGANSKFIRNTQTNRLSNFYLGFLLFSLMRLSLQWFSIVYQTLNLSSKLQRVRNTVVTRFLSEKNARNFFNVNDIPNVEVFKIKFPIFVTAPQKVKNLVILKTTEFQVYEWCFHFSTDRCIRLKYILVNIFEKLYNFSPHLMLLIQSKSWFQDCSCHTLRQFCPLSKWTNKLLQYFNNSNKGKLNPKATTFHFKNILVHGC